MTPRDALQNLIQLLAPAQTLRDDNLTQEQIRVRNSIAVLRELIESTETPQKTPQEYGLPPLSREDFIE
jgi:hypothetical protein